MNKEQRKYLIKLRDTIQDYLGAVDLAYGNVRTLVNSIKTIKKSSLLDTLSQQSTDVALVGVKTIQERLDKSHKELSILMDNFEDYFSQLNNLEGELILK